MPRIYENGVLVKEYTLSRVETTEECRKLLRVYLDELKKLWHPPLKVKK